MLVHVNNGMSGAESGKFFHRCGLEIVGGNYVEVLQ
ncbi:hypothetical protein IWQ54_003439 [Labrenzia sp. EL_195]|nr:hypothetical protein [Labrenzia sp. EL_195]